MQITQKKMTIKDFISNLEASDSFKKINKKYFIMEGVIGKVCEKEIIKAGFIYRLKDFDGNNGPMILPKDMWPEDKIQKKFEPLLGKSVRLQGKIAGHNTMLKFHLNCVEILEVF